MLKFDFLRSDLLKNGTNKYVLVGTRDNLMRQASIVSLEDPKTLARPLREVKRLHEQGQQNLFVEVVTGIPD